MQSTFPAVGPGEGPFCRFSMATSGELPTLGSLGNALDAMMPDYAFTESEQNFLETVRKGSLEDVEAYFARAAKRKSKEARTSEDEAKESRLGSFALVLAAQHDNYNLVKLLLKKGFTISEPHPRVCECSDCRSKAGLMNTLTRLNTYRALASPTYLSLVFLTKNFDDEGTAKAASSSSVASSDPIFRAFVLNGIFEKLTLKEYEFKTDYMHLSRRCEDFVVSLLNLCHTMNEVECVMTMPLVKGMKHVLVRTRNKDAKKLSVLNFAIKNQNDRVSEKPDSVSSSVDAFPFVTISFCIHDYYFKYSVYSLIYALFPAVFKSIIIISD